MKEFTNDEKIIAKNINERYKWMARESSGNLFVYAAKPLKMKHSWGVPININIFDSFGEPEKFFLFNHLFHSIKWEDEEPTRIMDIYNPPILNDAEREYLKTVLKPFRGAVKYVKKPRMVTQNTCLYHIATEYLPSLILIQEQGIQEWN